MAPRLAEPLAAFLLEHPQLRPARLALDDADDPGARDERRAGEHLSGVLLDEQYLLERHFGAVLAQQAVDLDNRARRHPDLTTPRLNDGVHGRFLSRDGERDRLGPAQTTSLTNGFPPRQSGTGSGADYLRRTRVPLIFWLLSVLRKLGMSRSISSKYDDSAGVVWLAL